MTAGDLKIGVHHGVLAADPLNALQVQLLRGWRASGDEGVGRPLARSIAGIAAALRNTG